MLRFVSAEGNTLYRLLVASRNLTFDRSWDTLLVLEGVVDDRRRENWPGLELSRFVAALPRMATGEVAPTAREAAELVSRELPAVSFEAPPGFTGLDFWALGLDERRPWPFGGSAERLLCISPFVTNGLLNQLPGRETGALVSRVPELDGLSPETHDSFAERYVLRQEAEADEEADEDAGEAGSAGELAEDPDGAGYETLWGLHAKLYVAETGAEVRVWTGSANATHAAFAGNVEFLVELRGNTRECGIDRILHGPEGETGLRELLQEYARTGTQPDPDPIGERLEVRAEEIQRRIATLEAKALVSGSPDENGRYAVELRGSSGLLESDSDVTVRCRPVTLGQDRAVILRATECSLAEFELSLGAVTAFFAFEVGVSDGGTSLTRRFVINAPVVGAPDGREDAIVESLLSDPQRIMRLIMMLLAEGHGNERELAIMLGASGGAAAGRDAPPAAVRLPLFEELVRALWENPEALDRIDGMLSVVRRSEVGAGLIPRELEEIWPQIMEARRGVERRGR